MEHNGAKDAGAPVNKSPQLCKYCGRQFGTFYDACPRCGRPAPRMLEVTKQNERRGDQ